MAGNELRSWRRQVDAERARLHMQHLVSEGHTITAIAELSGVSRMGAQRIYQGEWKSINPDLEAAILAVNRGRLYAETTGLVPAIGTQRRLMALMARGWRATDFPLSTSVYRLLSRSQVTKETYDQVVALYEERKDSDGPSSYTRGRARGLGYAPPSAWDDLDMDDPWVQPHKENTPIPREERVSRVEDMLEAGWSVERISKEFGVKPRSLGHSMRRAGRPDLARIFEKKL